MWKIRTGLTKYGMYQVYRYSTVACESSRITEHKNAKAEGKPLNRRLKLTFASITFILLITVSLLPPLHSLNQSSGPKTASNMAPVSAGNSGSNFLGYSFPYAYQQPTVPSSVGVQGIAGTTVGISSIGPIGHIGITGSIGPTSTMMVSPNTGSQRTAFPVTESSVSVLVLNGTFQPSAANPSVHTKVVFENISLGTSFSAYTTNGGYANFTLPEGWYFLTIEGGSNIGFSQEISVRQNPFQITRYLVPEGNNSIPPIDNGPSSSFATVRFNVYFDQGYVAPQVSVSIYNGSLSGSMLGTGITDAHGNLNFTDLSSSYTYWYEVNGYYQSATGVFPGGSNVTGSFTPTSSVYNINVPVAGKTSWTSQVIGSAPSQGYVNVLDIASNSLTFVGGVVYISAPFTGGLHYIHFKNATVYLNGTWSAPNWQVMIFDNCTVIALSPIEMFGNPSDFSGGQNYTQFTNSIFVKSNLGISASELQSYNGVWMVGQGWNSIFEGNMQQSSSGEYVGLAGTYTNCLFNDFHVWSNQGANSVTPNSAVITLIGSTALNCDFPPSNLVIVSSNLTSVSFEQGAGRGLFNNSYISLTATPTWPTVIPDFQLNILHSSMRLAAGSGLNFMPSCSWNMSYSIWNQTPLAIGNAPEINLEGQQQFYNDYFVVYPNASVRWWYANNNFGPALLQFRSNGYMYMNYSLVNGTSWMQFDGGGVFRIGIYHTAFRNQWFDNGADPFEMFANVPSSGIGRLDMGNDSFSGFWTNKSMTNLYLLNAYQNLPYWQTWNVPNPPTSPIWGYCSLNYSTFQSQGWAISSAYTIGMGEGGISYWASHDVFWNNASNLHNTYQNSWSNGSYPATGGVDIQIPSGYFHMDNTWFMNLTNQTAAIGGDDSAGQGAKPYINLKDNYYFYYPNPMENYIPTFTTPLTSPIPYSTMQIYSVGSRSTTVYHHVNMSYELPVAYNNTWASSPQQSMYVFNSTVGQHDPFESNRVMIAAYTVEPDVNTTSGRPVVYYYNGLVGGIQPNFTWNGSSYQLAVESNMTYIAAQSPSASPVGIQFQVPVGLGSMNVWMFNSSSGKIDYVKSVVETGTVSTVTVEYNPSTMPLRVVFFTNLTTSSKITFTESGLPSGTRWGVTLGQVQSSSTASSISFDTGKGTFAYTVSAVSGYTPHPSSGNVTVANASANVRVQWSMVKYVVAFVETGLSGQSWGAVLNGVAQNTTAKELDFSETNGTYNYIIVGPNNYTSNVNSGQILVSGRDIVQNITFASNVNPPGTSNPPTTTPIQNPTPTKNAPSSGKLGLSQWFLIVATSSVFAASYVGVYMMMDKPRLPPKKAATSKLVKRTVIRRKISARKGPDAGHSNSRDGFLDSSKKK